MSPTGLLAISARGFIPVQSRLSTSQFGSQISVDQWFLLLLSILVFRFFCVHLRYEVSDDLRSMSLFLKPESTEAAFHKEHDGLYHPFAATVSSKTLTSSVPVTASLN
jgi:hypothetical protein